MNIKLFLKFCVLFVVTCVFISFVCALEPRVEVFYPKGFEISIPDEEGLSRFSFRAKLNEKFLESYEAGTWKVDLDKAENGRWAFRDSKTQLRKNDIIYYWIRVIFKSRRYYENYYYFVVKKFANSLEPVQESRSIELSLTPLLRMETTESSCSSSKTIMNGAPIRCAGQIVFEDDFSGSLLDSSRWKVERCFPAEPDYEFVWYLDDIPEVLTVANSMVSIKPIAASQKIENPLRRSHNLGSTCTGKQQASECIRQGGKAWDVPPFISAQFSTKGRFAFKYGRVELRAKLPNAPWVFPEIWLQPVTETSDVNQYQLGQMRIAFTRVNGTAIDLFGGLILHRDEPLRSVKMCKKSSSQNTDWGKEFHVYSLTWTEDLVIVAVDNEEYCSISLKSDADLDILAAFYNVQLPSFDREFYITLGYGIGGHFGFEDRIDWQEEKPWINTEPKAMKNLWNKKKENMQHWLANGDFKIDYVKVFSV